MRQSLIVSVEVKQRHRQRLDETYSACACAGSTQQQLAAWMASHPLPPAPAQGPAGDADGEMQRLIASMSLPTSVARVLEDSLYCVPATGFFTTQQSSFESVFEWWDVVHWLVHHASSIGTVVANAILLHGPEQSGKSLCMPWAQFEAMLALQAAGGSLGPRCGHALVSIVQGHCCNHSQC